MSDNTEPAFPHKPEYDDNGNPKVYPGLTKREYFAAAALTGLLARDLRTAATGNQSLKWADVNYDPQDYTGYYVRVSYELADAMLEAGRKP